MNLESRYDVLRRRPRLLDGLIVGGLVLFTALPLGFGSRWWIVLLSIAIIVPLWWRRRYPLASAGAMAVVCLFQLAVYDQVLPSDIAPLFAIYATAAYGSSRRRRVAGLAMGVGGAIAGGLRWSLSEQPGLTWSQFAVIFAFSLMGLGMSAVSVWILGDLLRSRREVLENLQKQNAALARDQEQRAAIAAQEERTRIAREMHDIVAHSLSVVVVQADGGAYAARSGPADTAAALERAASTLDTIGATARQALTETRRLVGVLRQEDSELELAPQAGLDEIEHVVKRMNDAGIPTSYDETGRRGELPREVELAAYRVVQESLTNVMKHAGPDAIAHVEIAHLGDRLMVLVTDDGRGAAADGDGDGNGIVGMRERVQVYGGSLTAGPRHGAGFAVRATIPMVGDTSLPASTQGATA